MGKYNAKSYLSPREMEVVARLSYEKADTHKRAAEFDLIEHVFKCPDDDHVTLHTNQVFFAVALALILNRLVVLVQPGSA